MAHYHPPLDRCRPPFVVHCHPLDRCRPYFVREVQTPHLGRITVRFIRHREPNIQTFLKFLGIALFINLLLEHSIPLHLHLFLTTRTLPQILDLARRLLISLSQEHIFLLLRLLLTHHQRTLFRNRMCPLICPLLDRSIPLLTLPQPQILGMAMHLHISLSLGRDILMHLTRCQLAQPPILGQDKRHRTCL